MSNNRTTINMSRQGTVGPSKTQKRRQQSNKPRVNNPSKGSAQRRNNAVNQQSQKAFVASANLFKTNQPKFNGSDKVLVSHRELVGPVKDTNQVGFHQILRLRLNPGSKNTFDWLSTIAPNFEFYRFKHLSFTYETRVATSTEGSLIMCPDYDASDGVTFLTEKSIFSNLGASDDAVWKSRTVTVNPALMNRLYKAHPTMSDERFENSSQDEKTIDAGQFFVALDTQALNRVMGKLIVSYSVEFWGPQSPTEAMDQGGFYANSINNTTASNKPFVTPVNLFENEVLETGQFLAGYTNPSATVGRFLKDYEGLISIAESGTGLSGSPTVFTGPLTNLNLDAGAPGDILQTPTIAPSTVTNPGSTSSITNTIVKAKKGDLLRVRSNSFTTLANMVLRMGGGLGSEINY